jgi:cation transport protein ChaC
VRNWGTKENPGPTLNIEHDKGGTCLGLAFEFPEKDKPRILEYLTKREGKAFALEECIVSLEDGREVSAVVPIYKGKNILSESLEALSPMASQAAGTSGKCVDYVLNIETHLKTLDIHDAEVSSMAELVRKKMTKKDIG